MKKVYDPFKRDYCELIDKDAETFELQMDRVVEMFKEGHKVFLIADPRLNAVREMTEDQVKDYIKKRGK